MSPQACAPESGFGTDVWPMLVRAWEASAARTTNRAWRRGIPRCFHEEIRCEVLSYAWERYRNAGVWGDPADWLARLERDVIRNWSRGRDHVSLLESVRYCRDAIASTRPGAATTPSDDPEREAIARETAWRLARLVRAAPEGYREVLLPILLQALPLRELADRLHVSEKSAERRLARARQWLQSNWQWRIEAASPAHPFFLDSEGGEA